jgi:uncharacterized membrane protein
MQYRASVNLSFWLMLCATLTYLVGTFGVTISGNVLMSETLDALSLAELTTDGLKDIRISYEGKWNHYTVSEPKVRCVELCAKPRYWVRRKVQ